MLRLYEAPQWAGYINQVLNSGPGEEDTQIYLIPVMTLCL